MIDKFIVLEGCEGSGKTTLGNALVSYLNNHGYKAIFTREPGGVEVSEQIRDIILNNPISDMTEALLFCAARVQHLNEKIIKYLNEGYYVICDRYIDSSIVYQGIAKGLSVEYVKNLNYTATNNFLPYKTLYLDIDPEVGISRVLVNNRETNRFDKMNLEFHKKIRAGYFNLYQNREDVVTLDASNSPEELLSEAIKEILND